MNSRMVLDQDACFDSQYLLANVDEVNYDRRIHRDYLEKNKDQSRIWPRGGQLLRIDRQQYSVQIHGIHN